MTATADRLADLYEYLDTDEKKDLERLVKSDTRVVDPLARLFDPAFTPTLWPYEFSQTDPEIPGNLHKKQVEALHADAKHRSLFWGNQVGKTTIGAIDCVSAALGRHPILNDLFKPPLTIWASALSWDLWEKILLPELLTWIPRNRLIDAPHAHQKSTKRDILIRADNGRISRITGKSAEQGADKYQSARVHLVWLDEEHPEKIWDEMQPRLLRHGGRTLSTMTPLKGLSWVYHRIYEPFKRGQISKRQHFMSHAGLVDNPAIAKSSIDALRTELAHNPAQLEARLYGHFVKPQGLVLPFDADKHMTDLDDEQIERLVRRGQPFAGLDFGAWRFAFVLMVPDADGRVHLIDEVFSQRETLDKRALRIHKLLTRRKVNPRNFWIWGDCANPTDIMEINKAFERQGSPYRVVAVGSENKLRRTGASRIENLINRGAFVVRRGLGSGQTWMLGMSAAKAGSPVEGSRWMWEANNWLYPTDDSGEKAQKDDPDDNSADGADMMAATRYAIMSWWKAAPRAPAERGPDAEDVADNIIARAKKRERAGEIYTPSMGITAPQGGYRPARWNTGRTNEEE